MPFFLGGYFSHDPIFLADRSIMVIMGPSILHLDNILECRKCEEVFRPAFLALSPSRALGLMSPTDN